MKRVKGYGVFHGSQLMFAQDYDIRSAHHLPQSFFSQPFCTMATQQFPPRAPDIKFRVLIIGRANAGKTSILQRVCDTTESPEIYRLDPDETRHLVCSYSR